MKCVCRGTEMEALLYRECGQALVKPKEGPHNNTPAARMIVSDVLTLSSDRSSVVICISPVVKSRMQLILPSLTKMMRRKKGRSPLTNPCEAAQAVEAA
jgi:hypothetical protein